MGISDGSSYVCSSDLPCFRSHHLAPSLLAIMLAFLFAAIFGILVGLILWRFGFMRRMFDPWLSIYYAIPTFALYPLLVVVAGIGLLPVILLGALMTIVSVITATLDGLDRSDERDVGNEGVSTCR